jgi:hypothetical protein
MASMGNMVAGWGMLIVETIAKVRRAYFIHKKPIKAICRELRLSRRVVRKVIRSEATEFHYERRQQPLPRIDPWRDRLDGLLLENEGKPARERRRCQTVGAMAVKGVRRDKAALSSGCKPHPAIRSSCRAR